MRRPCRFWLGPPAGHAFIRRAVIVHMSSAADGDQTATHSSGGTLRKKSTRGDGFTVVTVVPQGRREGGSVPIELILLVAPCWQRRRFHSGPH